MFWKAHKTIEESNVNQIQTSRYAGTEEQKRGKLHVTVHHVSSVVLQRLVIRVKFLITLSSGVRLSVDLLEQRVTIEVIIVV